MDRATLKIMLSELHEKRRQTEKDSPAYRVILAELERLEKEYERLKSFWQ